MSDVKIQVVTVTTDQVDRRLPPGEFLVEVLPNGDLHIAYRENTWDTWPAGTWVTPD